MLFREYRRKSMEYLTVREVAMKWNLSERRLQTMCNEGLILGVKRFGKSWAIPSDAKKPEDKRVKSGKYIKHKKQGADKT
jgi:hypothetical protein